MRWFIVGIMVLLVLAACSEQNASGQATFPPPSTSPQTNNITYLDPSDCVQNVYYPDPANVETTSVDCHDSGRVISEVTHIGCPSSTRPEIVGSAWMNGRTPSFMAYTCTADNGARSPPSYIFAYCCAIKSTGVMTPPTGPLHKTSIDKTGKLSVS